MNNIYINSVKQISAQHPLVDDWFENPIFHNEPFIRAIDPDYKQFFTPNEARRFGKILKRALLASRQAMEESHVSLPEAIITGTGLGCIENTEIFLNKLLLEGEQLLNPTHFMQSTHNTISSLIAIDTKCHAYNSTYAHKGISFECALQDAFLQLKNDEITTALVGAHDEMTPVYFSLLKKIAYLGKTNQTFAGEAAVAMMLSTKKNERTLCKIEAVDKIYSNNIQNYFTNAEFKDIDYVMIGVNGDPETDDTYFNNCEYLLPGIPLLQYKNIFGESYSASALGVYAAALCLQREIIPEHLKISKTQASHKKPHKILCYNHFENKNHTFVLLSK